MSDDPLLAGYRRFRAQVWPSLAPRFARMAREGQRPHTAVLACSDARVDPQSVFDAEPGSLFVIRNVAGLVPEYAPDGGCHGTSAALEYAVKILKVKRLVVLGHADCDGIHAMIHGPVRQARDFLTAWVDIAEPVLWPLPEPGPGIRFEDQVEVEAIRLSLRNLRTFPWIAERERSGALTLLGYRFDFRAGLLSDVGEALGQA